MCVGLLGEMRVVVFEVFVIVVIAVVVIVCGLFGWLVLVLVLVEWLLFVRCCPYVLNKHYTVQTRSEHYHNTKCKTEKMYTRRCL